MWHRSYKGIALALVVGTTLSCVPDAPEGGLPPGPGPGGVAVTLAWDPPVTDAAGDPLEDLAGYRLYYSRETPPDGPVGTVLDVGPEPSATLEQLEPAVWFFAVTAVDVAGNESVPSAILRVDLGDL